MAMKRMILIMRGGIDDCDDDDDDNDGDVGYAVSNTALASRSQSRSRLVENGIFRFGSPLNSQYLRRPEKPKRSKIVQGSFLIQKTLKRQKAWSDQKSLELP